jgi:hypothetical protein
LFPAAIVANEIEDLVAESKSLIQSYATQLQTAYDNAFDSNNPDAIQVVCQNIAMKIAGNLAQDEWIIRRTGLDVLNKNNAPDQTELKVLHNFITRQSEEKNIEALSWYKFNETGNQSEFRYIRAFTMENRCMTCHKHQESKTGSPPALSAYTLTKFETRNYFPDPVLQDQHAPLPTFTE